MSTSTRKKLQLVFPLLLWVLLSPLQLVAETHVLTCGSTGIPYDGLAELSLAGEGTPVFTPESSKPASPTTPAPGERDGLTPDGDVNKPTTPGPKNPNNAPLTVEEDAYGTLVITQDGTPRPIYAEYVGNTPEVLAQCHPKRQNNPECGPGASQTNRFKRCPKKGQECKSCKCRWKPCKNPKSTCDVSVVPGTCGERKICKDKGKGVCSCEDDGTTGPRGEPIPPKDGQEEGEMLFQPNWADFSASDESLTLEEIEELLTSTDGDSGERMGATSTRANRGGTWYWISSYPAALVNLNLSISGEEFQIYQAGERKTYARRQDSSGAYAYYLVKTEDSFGNITTIERDSANRVTAENYPGNLRVEYAPLVSGSWHQGYSATTSRCDDSYANCTAFDEIRYQLNSSGAPTEITYLNAAPYVLEPTTSQGVHDISSQQTDPLVVRYAYDPTETKIISISYERGGVARDIAGYEYYSSYSPNAGKLWKITDSKGQITTVTYPTADTIVMSLPTGEVQRTRFDSQNRIIESTSTISATTSSAPQRVGVQYSYAAGSRCDFTMSEMRVDRGDGQYQTLMSAIWDADLYRLLAISVPGPNGNLLTTTYDNHTEWLDGNMPQSIVTPRGPIDIEYQFSSMPDPTDARFRVTSWQTTSSPVTEEDGVYRAVSEVALTPDGLLDKSRDESGAAQYSYDTNRLLSLIETGPTLQGLAPDMTSPYSYTMELVRDTVTGEVSESYAGSGDSRIKAAFTYENGALTRVQGGGSDTQLYYSRWGAPAARYVTARDRNGGAFGGTGRDKWGFHYVRNDEGELLGIASDIASPFSSTPEYFWTRYTYDSYGRVESTMPDVGAKKFYTYDERSALTAVYRDSPQGVLLSSFSQIPSGSSVRFLSGEHQGQPVYEEVTRNISPSGYIASVNSSMGRSASFQYTDFGNISEVASSLNGVVTSRTGATYDEWGRELEVIRYNPVTGEAEVLNTYTYANGRASTVLDRYGTLVAKYYYDPVGGVREVETSLGITRYEVEPFMARPSRMAETTGGYTRVYGYEYESSTGRLAKFHDYGSGSQSPRTVSYGYDSLGHTTFLRAPDGRTAEKTYGPNGSVWKTSSDELTMNYTYKVANGEYSVERSVASEGRVTRRYGAFGIIGEEYSDGRSAAWQYSSFGFLKTHTTSDGRTSTFFRDNQGRVEKVSTAGRYGPESYEVFRDNLDRAYKKVLTRGGRVSTFEVLEFGQFGEIKQVQHTEPGRANGVPLEIAYQRIGSDGRYTPDAISGMSLNNEATWSSQRDSLGRLQAVEFVGGSEYPSSQPARFEFGYDGGVQNSLKYPSSTELEAAWSYSSFGELQAVVNTQGTDRFISGKSYERDELGRVVRANTDRGVSTSSEFTYEESRLKTSDEVGGTTEFTYRSNNVFMLHEKTFSDGTVFNYERDDQGRYSQVGGHALEYDDQNRVTKYGSFSYEYRDGDLLPEVVSRDGKRVRSFEYDMFGNLIATENARGVREEFITYGTQDFATVDPDSGSLQRAFVTFPGVGTEREKVAAIGLQDGEKSYFQLSLSPVEGEGVFTKSGERVERYETRFGEGSFSVTDVGGQKKEDSLFGSQTGFHGLRAFDDIAPNGGALITPLRIFFPQAGFANAPDPLEVPGQMWSFNDADSVNKTDPTGGQTDNFNEAVIAYLRGGGESHSGPGQYEVRNGVRYDNSRYGCTGGYACGRVDGGGREMLADAQDQLSNIGDVLSDMLDELQLALDVGGVADPTPICDGANCLLYFVQGEWGDAGISLAAMIPVWGDTLKIGRHIRKIPKAEALIKAFTKKGRTLSERCNKFISTATEETRRKLQYALDHNLKGIVDIPEELWSLRADLMKIQGEKGRYDKVLNGLVEGGDEFFGGYLKGKAVILPTKNSALVYEIKNPGSGWKFRAIVEKLDKDLYRVLAVYPAHRGGQSAENALIKRILGVHGIE